MLVLSLVVVMVVVTQQVVVVAGVVRPVKVLVVVVLEFEVVGLLGLKQVQLLELVVSQVRVWELQLQVAGM